MVFECSLGFLFGRIWIRLSMRRSRCLEETAEQVLARLNEYTGHTVNAEIIYPTGSDQKGASYHHWYVINGDIVDQSVSDIQLPIFGVVDPMYNHMKKFYHRSRNIKTVWMKEMVSTCLKLRENEIYI